VVDAAEGWTPRSSTSSSGELWPGQSVLVGWEGDPADTEQAELIFRGAGKRTLVPDTVPADRASRNHSRSDGR
jgi:hypothetical protein